MLFSPRVQEVERSEVPRPPLEASEYLSQLRILEGEEALELRGFGGEHTHKGTQLGAEGGLGRQKVKHTGSGEPRIAGGGNFSPLLEC